MSAAVTALRRKAQSYFRDGQKLAGSDLLADKDAGGFTVAQWVVVYKAVATELHKVADEIQAGEDA